MPISSFFISSFFSPVGNVYVADYGNNRVRKVTVSTGVISTIAGTGVASYSGDGGVATSATLNAPIGVALDHLGRNNYILVSSASATLFTLTLFQGDNVFIGDYSNNRIRMVTISTGIISTVAGTGTGSYSGDGGPATSATLKHPCGVALDASGRQSR